MSAKMSSTPPRLPALFRMLWQQTYPEMLRQVNAAGFDDIRLGHWPVLQWPGPEGQRPSVIAERAGTSKQAVNHVLRDLGRLGYVELRPDPRDSRARLVELTARGHALVERCSTPRPPPNGNSSRCSQQANDASSRRH